VGVILAFSASSIKFFTRSLKSRYMKIREANCWVLLDLKGGKTISWSTWRYVDSSNSCWPYDQNCRCTPCAHSTYCSMMWGFMGQLLSSQKSPSAGGGSMLARKLLACPSKLMRSSLPWSSPLLSPLFNIRCFGPKSQGMSFSIGLYCSARIYLCLPKSSKILGMKRHCP
jgi:hypothetical protein